MMMDEIRSKRFEVYALAFFLALTFVLSLKQLYPFSSVDEVEIFNWIKQADQESFPAINYPPLFIYFHYLLSWIYGQVFSFLGIIPSASDFLYTETGFRFTIEAGRAINAGIASLTVYWVYKTGRDYYGGKAGLAAALFMACNPLVILYAHVFKPEMGLILFMTISLYYLLKYLYPHPSANPKKSLFIAASFFGLALACKYSAFPLLAVFLTALILPRPASSAAEPNRPPEYAKRDREKSDRSQVGKIKKIRKIFSAFPVKKWTVVPAGIVAGFVVGAPNWLVNPVENFKLAAQYSPATSLLYRQFQERPTGEIYGALFRDIFNSIGPVMVAVFLIALVTGFFTRSRRDLLLSVYILAYILLFSVIGYYAPRLALPIFPAAAVLTGKLFFHDLEIMSHRKSRWNLRKWWKTGIYILWGLLALNGLIYTFGNIKTFNLLKTQSQRDRSAQYRAEHNLEQKRLHIGHQVLTPRIQSPHVKIDQQFMLRHPGRHKNKILHFIQAHMPTYQDYIAQEKKSPGAIDLTRYRPFYTIKKRIYQSWNPECLFLYRVPRALLHVKPGHKNIRFPRPYYAAENTSFLPLQVYEKNPNFGVMKNGRFFRTIYSTRRINRLIIWLFSYQPDADVVLRVNNLEKTIQSEGRPPIQQFVIKEPAVKMLHFDYIYDIELSSSQKNLARKPYYIVWEPVYEPGENTGQPAVFTRSSQGNIPAVFTKHKFPLWALMIYKETGIDVSLLAFLSTHYMYNDTTGRLWDTLELDFTPVEKGEYFVRVDAEPASPFHPLGPGAVVECTYYSMGGGRRERIQMKGKAAKLFPLNINDSIAFVKIKIKNLRENNYLVKNVSLTPNYLWYYNNVLVTKHDKRDSQAP